MNKNLNMQQKINDLRIAILLESQDPGDRSSSGGETSLLWKAVGSACRPQDPLHFLPNHENSYNLPITLTDAE